jgi:hypothetical protein
MAFQVCRERVFELSRNTFVQQDPHSN